MRQDKDLVTVFLHSGQISPVKLSMTHKDPRSHPPTGGEDSTVQPAGLEVPIPCFHPPGRCLPCAWHHGAGTGQEESVGVEVEGSRLLAILRSMSVIARGLTLKYCSLFNLFYFITDMLQTL